MAKKASILTVVIGTGLAVAGLIGLSTCASNRKTSPVSEAPLEKSPEKASEKEIGALAEVKSRPTTLDERAAPIIADAVAKWDQLQGVTATVKTKLEQAAGTTGTTVGEGTYECQTREGKLLIRFWITNTIRFHEESRSVLTGEIIDDLYDGEYLFKQLQQPKLKQVTKRAYAPGTILQIGGRELFRSLSEKYDLRLAGEETVNEQPAYVIEAIPLEGSWKTKHYFDKQTGIRVKMVELDDQGAETLSVELSEIKLNPEFSEDTFRYTLPEGFRMIDETGVNP